MPLLWRWFAPAACFGLAAWVWASTRGGEQVWVLTGADLLVGPDPHAQAALTWKVLIGVGLLMGALSLRETLRDRADDEDG